MPPRLTGRGPQSGIRTGPNGSPSSHDSSRPTASSRWRRHSSKRRDALHERSLEADPENAAIAAELAEVLLDQQRNDNATGWTVLRAGGDHIRRRRDPHTAARRLDPGQRNEPDRDVYTVVARPGLNRIIAIRLEALPDPSLPGGGPGRHPGEGNFDLNEWSVSRPAGRVH